jgi:hypothetical protein
VPTTDAIAILNGGHASLCPPGCEYISDLILRSGRFDRVSKDEQDWDSMVRDAQARLLTMTRQNKFRIYLSFIKLIFAFIFRSFGSHGTATNAKLL